MEQTIVFSELSSHLQEVLKYIATAAAGGIIGNRTDDWFKSLFFHQRKNLVNWLHNWQPTVEDVKAILEDENIRMLFSKITKEVSDELDPVKISLWPKIADSIIRNKDLPFDKKQYFVSMFNRLDAFSLKYLATLRQNGNLLYTQVFDLAGRQVEIGTEKHTFQLAQLQCSSTGFVYMYTDSIKSRENKFSLTNLGIEFIDFIGNASEAKLNTI